MARRRVLLFALPALALLLSACGRNMADQPKAELYEASPYFADGASARPLLENTVARERGGVATSFYSGLDDNGALLEELPVPLSLELIQRGQERYGIYCAPCHNFNGNGQGMVVQKGFPQPTSLHDARLRGSPVGYFYSVISNGFGRMFPYASRIPPEDRWAISAYIRALQLSQNGSLDDLPDEARLEPTLPDQTLPDQTLGANR